MREAWMQEWALRALRCTTLEDPLSAALGAVDCMQPFLREPGVPDADGRYPLPDLHAHVAAVAELVRPLLTGGREDPGARA